MKKAKQVLLLIGGILSIVYVVSFIISGAVLLLLGSPALTEAIKSGIENGAIHSDLPGGAETVQTFLSTFGATMLAEFFELKRLLLIRIGYCTFSGSDLK